MPLEKDSTEPIGVETGWNQELVRRLGSVKYLMLLLEIKHRLFNRAAVA
jgi:hypothetical protein